MDEETDPIKKMEIRMEKSKQSSMLVWYPKIKGLDIPQPKTIILNIPPSVSRSIGTSGPMPEGMIGEIYDNAHSIGFPLFVRTDHTSVKHSWSKTCFVEKEEQLMVHIWNIFESMECMMDIPFNALVFREYIDMDSKFCAFNGLPISKERRYFIRDGQVLCHHPYWPQDAIKFYDLDKPFTDEQWKQWLAEMNTETPDEIELLTKYAMMVGEVLPGHWSVDFCHGLNNKWYLIDMALADVSWHPEHAAER